MGHFFPPPPPPIVAANAAQPHSPPKAPPSTLIVPDPPFAYEGTYPNAAPSEIVALWQPDPWVYAYQSRGGRKQPYEGATLPPSLLIVPPPNPRHPMRSQQFLQQMEAQLAQPSAWPYVFLEETTGAQPYGGPTFVPPPTPVVVTYTPYNTAWMATVLSAWQPTAPPPTLPGLLNPFYTAVRVDNPPPYSTAYLAGLLAGWQPPDPPPTLPRNLSPGIPGQSVDNPPGFSGFDVYSTADPPLPQPLQYIVQPGAVVVVQKSPYNNLWLASVVASWQPVAPAPVLPRNISPGIPGQSVDNPPGLGGFDIYSTDEPPLPQTNRYAVQPGPVVVQYGPYNNLWLATVVAAWQPVSPPPTLPTRKLSPGIPGVSVDNPPGVAGMDVYSWEDYGLPILPKNNAPGIPGQSVDNPPGIGRYAVISFQKPRLLQTDTQRFFTPGIPVNNPPFAHGGHSAWVATLVVQAWQPPDPLPTLSGKLNPSITAVPVNNPPFSGRTELPGILAQWATWPPSQFPTPYIAPPQVQPGPPPPPIVSVPDKFTVSGPDVSTYLQEFFYDVSYTDAPITKRTV